MNADLVSRAGVVSRAWRVCACRGVREMRGPLSCATVVMPGRGELLPLWHAWVRLAILQ